MDVGQALSWERLSVVRGNTAGLGLGRRRRRTAGAGAGRGRHADERVAALRRVLSDYGGLTRYGSENTELPPPRAGESRVVFFGDDATERWQDPGFFRAGRYVNRGIAGQNSAQLLLRFRQDVIGLAPAVVVIHAGSNDLARMLGPGTRGTFADNIMSMTELAKAHRIRVVLASILPVCDCFSDQTSLRSPVRLADFNEWLRDYAKSVDAVYLDYVPGAGRRPQLQA